MHSIQGIALAYRGHCHVFLDSLSHRFNNQSTFFDKKPGCA